MEAQYYQFKNMIHSFAWKFSRKHGIPVEDLLSEAHLIFCQSVESFDASKAQFSTHLYSQLRGHLLKFVNKEHSNANRYLYVHSCGSSEQVNAYEECTGIQDFNFNEMDLKDFLSTSSDDARSLVKWYFDGDLSSNEPKESKWFPLTPRSLSPRCKSRKGWSSKRTLEALSDLRFTMNMYRALA